MEKNLPQCPIVHHESHPILNPGLRKQNTASGSLSYETVYPSRIICENFSYNNDNHDNKYKIIIANGTMPKSDRRGEGEAYNIINLSTGRR